MTIYRKKSSRTFSFEACKEIEATKSLFGEKISATNLKSENKPLHKKLSFYAKQLGFRGPGHMLAFYDLLGHLESKRKCAYCGKYFDSYHLKKTCSKSCRSNQTGNSIIEKNRITDKEEISNRAKNSYASRRKNGNVKSSIEKQKNTVKRNEKIKKEKQADLLRKRVEKVICEGKLRLFLRIKILKKGFGKSGTLKAFSNELSLFSDLLPADFDYKLEKDISFYGMHAIKKCQYCGDLMKRTRGYSKKKYCSYDCANASPARGKLISERNKKSWENESYRNNQLEKMKERYENTTSEERKKWHETVMETMGVEGRNKRRDKALETKIEKGIISTISFDQKDQDYLEYRKQVNIFTNKNKNLIIENSGKPIGKRTNHLDHIFPISKGYYYGIPPKMIGDYENLQILDAFNNRSKGNKITKIPCHIKKYIEENNIDITY